MSNVHINGERYAYFHIKQCPSLMGFTIPVVVIVVLFSSMCPSSSSQIGILHFMHLISEPKIAGLAAMQLSS